MTGETTEAGSTPPASPVSGRLLRAAVLVYAVALLFAIGYALFGSGLRSLVGPTGPTPTLLLVGVALGLVLVLLTRTLVGRWAPFGRLADELARLLAPVGVGEAVLLALVSGVVEEVLFRGALWPDLGLVGTSVLFGLVHVVPRRPLWGYPLFALAAGLLLGLLREGSGSVAPPILAHVTLNAANLVWLGRRGRRAAAAGA